MASILINARVDDIVIDPQFPDQDGTLIYEHLKYYLTRPSIFPLPAVRVILLNGRLTVFDGHKYLQIARETRAEYIRAFFSSANASREDLLNAIPEGASLVPATEMEEELAIPVIPGCQVFFFEDPLDEAQQIQFRVRIAGFFENSKHRAFQAIESRGMQVSFPFAGRCAELRGNLPMDDQSWMQPFLSALVRFDREVAKIASFQGRKFQV